MTPGDPQQASMAMARLNRLSAQRARERGATEQELAELSESLSKCQHCGGYHLRACPRVKLLSFFPNGQIASVEFWPWEDVDWQHVVFEDQGAGDQFLDLLSDAWLLATWIGNRKGQAEYQAEARRRILDLFDEMQDEFRAANHEYARRAES